MEVRLPCGPPTPGRLADEVRALLRDADELKGRWEIEHALTLTEVAYHRRRRSCATPPDAAELLRIAARVAELSRRSVDPVRARDAYDRYLLPAVRLLGDLARPTKDVLPVRVAAPVVKELIALENESFARPAGGSWRRRLGWLRGAGSGPATSPEEVDSGERDSILRQLALSEIPRPRPPGRPAVPPPGPGVRFAAPLHYYGLRNLQAIESFDRRQPAAAVTALAYDYDLARQQIFTRDGSLEANAGERSTMMGMGLYLGIALWKTYQRNRPRLRWEECLADSRIIYEHSGGHARCIVTPAVRDAAAGCQELTAYLGQVGVEPPAAGLTDRIEEVWDLLQRQLPPVG